MIVKNEAQTLRHCLQSVSGVVSQIVIADTGSTDDTADIAREFGATVISGALGEPFRQRTQCRPATHAD